MGKEMGKDPQARAQKGGPSRPPKEGGLDGVPFGTNPSACFGGPKGVPKVTRKVAKQGLLF